MESVKSGPATVAAFVAAAASFLGCARLLWCVSARLSPSDRRRLFPRQLRSLAVAGLLVTTSAVPLVWVNFWHMQRGPAEDVCAIVYNVFRPARFVSALQETHMALTFLAQVVRATKVLHCLNRGIPVLWILGLVLGVVDAVLYPFHLDEHNICAQSGTGRIEVISICIIGSCVLTSVLASVATMVKASASFTTLAVQRRFFKRAVWYPCISVISYAPILIVYSFPALQLTRHFPAAVVFELCNGAMNAGMFCFQSHYASRLGGEGDASEGDTARISDDIQFITTFHVGFGGVDVVELLSDSATKSCASKNCEIPAGSDACRLSLHA